MGCGQVQSTCQQHINYYIDISECNNDKYISSIRKNSFENPQSMQELFPSSLQALLSKRDGRVINQQISTYPYNCIVKLIFNIKNQDGSFFGTGTLIAPKTVITAAHFLRDYHNMGDLDQRIMIDPPECVNSNRYKCTFKKHQDLYYPSDYDPLMGVQKDFGVIILKQPIVRQKYVKLGINFGFHNYPAQICGYPAKEQKPQTGRTQSSFSLQKQLDQKKPNICFLEVDRGIHEPSLQKKMKGLIQQTTKCYFNYSIDTTSGQSGSFILVERTPGQFIAVGNHSGNFMKKYNSGCRFRDYHYNQINSFCLSKGINVPKPFDFSNVRLKFPLNYYELQTRILEPSMIRRMPQLPSSIEPQRNHEANIMAMNPTLQTARSLFRQERNNESIFLCNKILKQQTLNEKQIIQALSLMGLNYHDLGIQQYSQTIFEKCYQRLSSLNQTDITTAVEIYNNMGTMYLKKNNKKAKQLFLKASQNIKKYKLEEQELNAATLSNLSIIDADQGNYHEALKKLQTAFDILIKKTAKSNQKMLVLQQIMRLLFQKRDYQSWINRLMKYFEIIIEMKVQYGVKYKIYVKESQNVGNDLKSNCLKWFSFFLQEIEQIFQLMNKQMHSQQTSVEKIKENQSFLLKVSIIYNEVFRGIKLIDQKFKSTSKTINTFLQQYNKKLS